MKVKNTNIPVNLKIKREHRYRILQIIHGDKQSDSEVSEKSSPNF